MSTHSLLASSLIYVIFFDRNTFNDIITRLKMLVPSKIVHCSWPLNSFVFLVWLYKVDFYPYISCKTSRAKNGISGYTIIYKKKWLIVIKHMWCSVPMYYHFSFCYIAIAQKMEPFIYNHYNLQIEMPQETILPSRSLKAIKNLQKKI